MTVIGFVLALGDITKRAQISYTNKINIIFYIYQKTKCTQNRIEYKMIWRDWKMAMMWLSINPGNFNKTKWQRIENIYDAFKAFYKICLWVRHKNPIKWRKEKWKKFKEKEHKTGYGKQN